MKESPVLAYPVWTEARGFQRPLLAGPKSPVKSFMQLIAALSVELTRLLLYLQGFVAQSEFVKTFSY